MAPQTGRITSHIVFLVILANQNKLIRNTFRTRFIETTCSDIRFLIGRCEFRIGRCANLRLDNDPTQNLYEERDEENDEIEDNLNQGNDSETPSSPDPRRRGRVTFEEESPRRNEPECEENGETNSRGNSRNHRRIYQEITPELLESIGFARNGGGPQNPNVVLKTNHHCGNTASCEKTMFEGGSGLEQFEKAFRTIVVHNGWSDVVAAVDLKDNLNVAAKKVVSNLKVDDDEIF